MLLAYYGVAPLQARQRLPIFQLRNSPMATTYSPNASHEIHILKEQSYPSWPFAAFPIISTCFSRHYRSNLMQASPRIGFNSHLLEIIVRCVAHYSAFTPAGIHARLPTRIGPWILLVSGLDLERHLVVIANALSAYAVPLCTFATRALSLKL